MSIANYWNSYLDFLTHSDPKVLITAWGGTVTSIALVFNFILVPLFKAYTNGNEHKLTAISAIVILGLLIVASVFHNGKKEHISQDDNPLIAPEPIKQEPTKPIPVRPIPSPPLDPSLRNQSHDSNFILDKILTKLDISDHTLNDIKNILADDGSIVDIPATESEGYISIIVPKHSKTVTIYFYNDNPTTYPLFR